MTMTDPVADMLTRLRNANSAHHDTVALPSSKLKTNIAEILKQEGYIADFTVNEPGVVQDFQVVAECRNCQVEALGQVAHCACLAALVGQDHRDQPQPDGVGQGLEDRRRALGIFGAGASVFALAACTGTTTSGSTDTSTVACQLSTSSLSTLPTVTSEMRTGELGSRVPTFAISTM